MDAWMTLLAALGPALAKALYEVGKEVVVKPLMGPAAERFKAWVRRGYDEYSPSWRSRAPTWPGSVQLSASFRMRSLYSAVNCRRLAQGRL